MRVEIENSKFGDPPFFLIKVDIDKNNCVPGLVLNVVKPRLKIGLVPA